jgi:hypothetical protein
MDNAGGFDVHKDNAFLCILNKVWATILEAKYGVFKPPFVRKLYPKLRLTIYFCLLCLPN